MGFLSSRLIGLPNSLNCKVARHLALVEVHRLYGTTSIFLSEFYSRRNSNTPTKEFLSAFYLESHFTNEVYVFNRDTGH